MIKATQMFNKLRRGFAPITILAILGIVGTGSVGTIAASDNAKPGDILFPLDQAVENIRLAIATAPEDKAEIEIERAEERLQEALGLTEENNEENIENALALRDQHLADAQAKAEEAKQNGKDVDEILAILAQNHLRQQEVLQGVYEKVPEQAKPAIQRSLEQSQKGYEAAVNAVSQGQREELLQGTRARLENARERMEANGIEPPDIDIPGFAQGNENENEEDESTNENGVPVDIPQRGRPQTL